MRASYVVRRCCGHLEHQTIDDDMFFEAIKAERNKFCRSCLERGVNRVQSWVVFYGIDDVTDERAMELLSLCVDAVKDVRFATEASAEKVALQIPAMIWLSICRSDGERFPDIHHRVVPCRNPPTDQDNDVSDLPLEVESCE